EITNLLGSLIGLMKNQARFKPGELVLAADESIFSRYLIAPHRTKPDAPLADGKAQEEPFAIASSLLGGFGGFLAQEFREHDYQLGRRNCQMFLLSSFALPPENEIIKGWSQDALQDSRFVALGEQGDPKTHCI